MRPIDKGTCPKVNGGADKTVTEYGQWRKDLVDRIGYYCCYCNMALSEQLQVEHVVAKVPVAGAVAGSLLDWDNMLLSCGVCNRAKSNQPSNSVLHYLPESHNSHFPFEIIEHPIHSEVAIVQPNSNGLNPIQFAKAKVTIDLFDLDVFDTRDKTVDFRWMKRRNAINAIEHMWMLLTELKQSQNYNAHSASIAATAIAYQAKEIGFFSLWYDKFLNEPVVMQALTDNIIIKGTARNCFDPTNGHKPINRNPANIPDPF